MNNEMLISNLKIAQKRIDELLAERSKYKKNSEEYNYINDQLAPWIDTKNTLEQQLRDY